jgi:hypothetical protein
MNGTGIVPQTDSLANRVRQASGRNIGPVDAGRQVDTGGLSAAGFGTSPIAQGGYGMTPQMPGQSATRNSATQTGVTMNPARLVQRINPVTVGRGGTRKEYEGGGP